MSGSNAASNSYSDDANAGGWYHARVNGFRPGFGPGLASVKRPVTGHRVHTGPASGRRPPGAGWGPGEGIGRHQPGGFTGQRDPRPQPSPRPQQWRSSFAPRAWPMGGW